MPDEAIWLRPPEPEIRLPTVNAPVRFSSSVPLLVTADPLGRLPDTPPEPNCSVPAAMMVPPAQLLPLLASTMVPGPSLVRVPAPETTWVSVPVTPALALSVPLLEANSTLRLFDKLKLLLNTSAPPFNSTLPLLLPNALSAPTAMLPPSMYVWPP